MADKVTSTNGVAVLERVPAANDMGELAGVPAKRDRNFADEHYADLANAERQVSRKYSGIRNYLRIFEVSRVLATLSLYLYLDQYELHYVRIRRLAHSRMQAAARLTRAAVYGEKLYRVRLWAFDKFMRAVRRFVLGRETDKTRHQEKQALWLKNKLIELGPTF